MAPAPVVVDVRDMLCAQALAQVATALERLPAGASLVVEYNAQDVKHDLLVWAADRRYTIREMGPDRLEVMRIWRTS